MPKRLNDQLEEEKESIPLSIQKFFWRLTSPFIRPKFGKQQDALAIEQKEACKSYEKILVQNICFGLSEELSKSIEKTSRWKLIQSALPYIIHCCSALLYNRKNSKFENKKNFLGTSETKLFYILHWIILDAFEECIDSDLEKNELKSLEYYLLPVTTIQVFIFQFAPLVSYLQKTNFLTDFRLENGSKLWEPIFNHEHPNITSFIKIVKSKKSIQKENHYKYFARKKKFDKIFIENFDTQKNVEKGVNKKSINLNSQLLKNNNIIIKDNINENDCNSKNNNEKKDKTENLISENKSILNAKLKNPTLATYLDVAVLRCLFASQWREEGIFWSLIFLKKRLKTIDQYFNDMKIIRPRSNSLFYKNISNINSTFSNKINKLENQIILNKQKSSSINAILSDLPSEKIKNLCNLPSIDSKLDNKTSKLKKQCTEEQINFSVKNFTKEESKFSLIEQNLLLDQKINKQKQEYKKQSKINFLSSSISKKNKCKNRPIRCNSFDFLNENNKTLKKLSKKTNQSVKNINLLKQSQTKINEEATINDEQFKKNKNNLLRGISMPSLNEKDSNLFNQKNLNKKQAINSSSFSNNITHSATNSYLIKKLSNLASNKIPVLSSNNLLNLQEDKLSKTNKQIMNQTKNQIDLLNNPIITIIEHNPINSSTKYLNTNHNQISCSTSNHLPKSPIFTSLIRNSTTTKNTAGGKNELSINDNNYSNFISSKKYNLSNSLIRSQTELNICYYDDSNHEALGALHYITKSGQISLLVILKAVHNISKRENVCTARVCQGIINLLNELIILGVLEHFKNEVNTLNQEFTVQHYFIDTCMNIFKHFGCEYGCYDHIDFKEVTLARIELYLILIKLYNSNTKQFQFYFVDLIKRKCLKDLIDLFHSFFNFCTSCSFKTEQKSHKNLSSSLSNDSNKINTLNSPKTNDLSKNLLNNLQLNEKILENYKKNKLNIKKIEDLIVKIMFPLFIDSVSKLSFNLNQNDIAFLYFDLRQFLVFIRECHNDVFRKISLSFLLESAELLKFRKKSDKKYEKVLTQQDKESQNQISTKFDTEEQIKLLSNTENESLINLSTKFSSNEKQTRKSFFKSKQIKKNYFDQSMINVEDGGFDTLQTQHDSIIVSKNNTLDTMNCAQSTYTLKNQPSNTLFFSKDKIFNNKINSKQNLQFENLSNNHLKESLKNKKFNQLLSINPFVYMQNQFDLINKSSNSNLQLNQSSLKKFKLTEWFKSERINNDHNNNQLNKKFDSNTIFVCNTSSTKENDNENKISYTSTNKTDGPINSASLSINNVFDLRQHSFHGKSQTNKSTNIHEQSVNKSSLGKNFKLHLISKRNKTNGLGEYSLFDENQQTQTANIELNRKNSLNLHNGISNQQFITSNETTSNQKNQSNQLTSKETDSISLKEIKTHSLLILKNGLIKFSFLLKSCVPGTLPDPALIAAVLNLQCPVLARCAFYLELANFIYNCNQENWPDWMCANVRNSIVGIMEPFSTRSIKNNDQDVFIKRYAGKMFYLWGEAIGSHLEIILRQEENKQKLIKETKNSDITDTQNSTNQKLYNFKSKKEIKEDFLDDRTVNLNGNDCPFVLKFAAVTCLTEITTYLREKYKYLSLNHCKPFSNYKTERKKLNAKLNLNKKNLDSANKTQNLNLTPSKSIIINNNSSTTQANQTEKKEETKKSTSANRRWSMVMSKLSQSSAHSLKLLTESNHPISTKESSTLNKEVSLQSIQQSTVPAQYNNSNNERRISFVLHEAEGENCLELVSNNTPIYNDNQTNNFLQHSHAHASKRISQSNTVATLTGASRSNFSRRGTGLSSTSNTTINTNSVQPLNTQSLINTNTFNQSNSFKRQSFRLKKERRTKRSTTFLDNQEEDSTNEQIKRTDSLHSKRKVSGISEQSDLSEQVDLSENEPFSNIQSEDNLSNSNNTFTFYLSEYYNLHNDQDDHISQKMPWLKVVNNFLEKLDYFCRHSNGCKENCYRKQMHSCCNLIKCIQQINKQDACLEKLNIPAKNTYEKNLTNLGNFKDFDFNTSNITNSYVQNESQRQLERKKGNFSIGSPIRRKVSIIQHNDRLIERDSHVNMLTLPTFMSHLEIESNCLPLIFNNSYNNTSTYLINNQSDHKKAFYEANKQRIFQKKFIQKKNSSKFQLDNYNDEDYYSNFQHKIRNLFHSPISLMLKAFIILPNTIYSNLLHICWNLILEQDQHLSCTAACAFIICSLKCSEEAKYILNSSLKSPNPDKQINAMLKFQTIWKFRYQCWPQMEDKAQQQIKIPPATIEFTLPSPKIAQSSMPVANPPWLIQKKLKVEEMTLNQEQTLQKSFVTATKTRRKQQIELIHRALAEEQEKLREERENYVISSVAIYNEASYEPALHKSEEHEEDPEDLNLPDRLYQHQLQIAQPIFTSSLCSASLVIINLLNSSQVNEKGVAVYEIAYKIIWYCLVEDTSLFLRNLFEKLTKKNSKYILQILRRLIRFMPRLPAQAAFSLYNYLIGFIMFHVRTPVEGSQELIGTTLSVLWLVVPSVHGLFLKGLKQVLRKEQCDAQILITANVPSAKNIIVHGPDAAVIPSQFSIQEDTQFAHILNESLEYFSIDKKYSNEYYLVDSKTNQIHNSNAYVRDFYFFKRSHYSWLSLVQLKPEIAFERLQIEALNLQFTEMGKVLMSLSIMNTPTLTIQRVLFLHEELMKLNSFPRKALESNFQLQNNDLYSKELNGMDALHKLVWIKLITKMLEVTSGFFAQSSDIHLFLNVINGALILHCEDVAILRLCMSAFINAAHQFKNIFNSNGYLLIMPTILRIYSNHQTNALLCKTIEYICKQFYILHSKPFLLQMFGSVSSILDINTNNNLADASKIQPKAFFQLLQTMDFHQDDPLQLLDFFPGEKPLKPLDFCYQTETDKISILDSISICVTVIGYAADSQRATQMLTILETILPLYMKYNQSLTLRKEKGGPQTELQNIYSISVCIKTLINNCEALTRNFTGPQRAYDLRGSSIKNTSKVEQSAFCEIDEDSHSNPITGSAQTVKNTRNKTEGYNNQYSSINETTEDIETIRFQFRKPRDTLLNVVCNYLTKSTARLAELSKKIPDLHLSKGSDTNELLDVKCHLRLAEIAHSLLKLAPYDPKTMACNGLINYMNEILPSSKWGQETMRPALIIILRRLDKMFNKIAKKASIRKQIDWEAAKKLLKGIYSTFLKHPYIVHLPHLKSLISICQYIVLGENINSNILTGTNTLTTGGQSLSGSRPSGVGIGSNAGKTVIGGIGSLAQTTNITPGLSTFLTNEVNNQLTNFNSWTTALTQSPPQYFCSVVVRLIALQILQLNENQTLETICSGVFSNSIEKTEIYLLNMIYPMCIKISSGIRESPKLRSCDITFILNIIISTLNAPTNKVNQNLSLWQSTISNRTITTNTLHQIGFLGMKIMIACFERQLSNDWHQIARCILDLTNKNNCIGVTLWKFFDFITTYRTPLFILLLPTIKYKLFTRLCENDQELFYQQLIAEKLKGKNMPQDRSKGNLLLNLQIELNNLKEDLINKRVADDKLNPASNSSTIQVNKNTHETNNHRLSFTFNVLQNNIPSSNQRSSILGFSTPINNIHQKAEDENKKNKSNLISKNNSNIQSSNSTPNRVINLLTRGISFRSLISSQSSDINNIPNKVPNLFKKSRNLSVRLPETNSNIVDNSLRRTSYPNHENNQLNEMKENNNFKNDKKNFSKVGY